MPASRHNGRKTARRGAARIDSIQPVGVTPLSARSREAEEEVEWRTDRWKHTVEAEARHRLKGEIRHVV